ncbi:hypothetical protein Taro_056709 [Colocasia esculenta]|uniref:Ionotropic glutamate receptor C-terminal domain-containing protein n=1 Tax=Colocasia esculenta TaxID=4460 RepID=A0A843XX89_COLES|nr:hypothetical protein [Colocasia esculenta]
MSLTLMKTSLPYTVDYDYIPVQFGGNRTTWTYENIAKQIVTRKYDAVVGDTTIMANRFFYVDFTLPYTETGVWMVVRSKEDRNSNGWVFLKPLRLDLWMVSLAFFCFTGFVVWAIEQRINLEFREEGLQSNLSRLVVIVWVFVVLILSSSYTASLTSMLTVEQLQATSVADLQRNGDYVGYQLGSFVEQRLKELNFGTSRLRGYNNPQEYEDALLTLKRKPQWWGCSSI